jgi:tetratricopeptide (TPR) repeat protein
LQLDESLPDAYVVQADLERLYDRSLVRAEESITRALALDPNHLDAHYTYALLLMTAGRFPEAISHMSVAERLDPLSPAIQSDFGRVLYRARRFDEAIPRLTRALELEPGMARVVNGRLGEVYEQMGRYDDALAAFDKAGGGAPSYEVARTYARMGRHREARQMLAELGGTSTAFTSAPPRACTRRSAIATRHSGYCSRQSITGSRRRS